MAQAGSPPLIFSEQGFFSLLKSDQVRVGDERQSSSGGGNVLDFDLQEIGKVAESAKDHKASHERCEAVGDADEEDVKDDVLKQKTDYLYIENTNHRF